MAVERADVRDRFRERLRGAGHDVRLATNGIAELRQSREPSADVVIVGIDEPGGDALETIAHLRRRTPGLVIVAVSTGSLIGDERLRRLARGAGADLAVTGFVDASALTAVIDELVARS